MNDPFASAPAAPEPEDAGPVDTPAEAPAEKPVGTATVAVKPVIQGLSTEGKVVLTFKGGTGFDAPWIVIHAESLQDAYDQVTGENASLLGELFTRVQNAGQAFAKLAPQPQGGGGGGGQQRGSAPQAAQEAPNGEKRYCAHGEMRFRSGTSKRTGKPYKMFVCQSGDRNDECDPQYLNSRN